MKPPTLSKYFLRGHQSGLTLVELLVALAISSIIAIAAISALIVSRRGLTTVDAASQLRDNGRFAIDLIQRLIVQTGFKDYDYAGVPADRFASSGVGTQTPAVGGANNSTPNTSAPDSVFTARSTGTGYGSDVLVLRFQSSLMNKNSSTSATDNAMIDCRGTPQGIAPTGPYSWFGSIFHVGLGTDGEPSLMCSTTDVSTPVPIVRGVENFQILFGTDNVTPSTAPTVTVTGIPNRFLRADEMTVVGDAVGTNANWRRVRNVRVGMVIRGPLGSTQDTVTQTFYPFGLAAGSSGGTAGTALSSTTNDIGTAFTPTPDTRLRQVVTFTVHLRNDQSL